MLKLYSGLFSCMVRTPLHAMPINSTKSKLYDTNVRLLIMPAKRSATISTEKTRLLTVSKMHRGCNVIIQFMCQITHRP